MLKQPSFWQDEKDAPLLGRNDGILKEGDTAVLDRAAVWPELCGAIPEDAEFKWPEPTDVSEEHQRIIVKDAQRTFLAKSQRESLIRVLTAAIKRFNDYQQGMSYVASFLLLTLDERTTLSILTRLNTHQSYIPNYWQHEAVAFATDAYVFEYLLRQHFPKVATHLTAIWPDTYCQKWFSGLAVHVLPFSVLFTFFEQFFKKGTPFLFQFALSLIEHIEEKLLQTQATDASTIYKFLCLDISTPFSSPEVTASIVAKAADYEAKVMAVDIAQLRVELFEAKLKPRLQAAKRSFEARNASDDSSSGEEEGEECQICNEKVPEMFCKTCQQLLCEECHEEEGGKHKRSHVVTSDWSEIEELTAALEKLKV